MAIIQKLVSRCSDEVERAIRYYSILSILNNLGLTKKDVQLMAFIAVNGTISAGGAKEVFIEMFGGSKASIGNVVFKLCKKGFLIHDGKWVVLHPQLRMDFSQAVVLQILITQ